ncbi:hypothetical protein PJ985_01245 [Streptomyces sp. ACA25]|uniref:hypothetical protein n=1 Tax=Streptomyces sp. ACA25 TaxID=3022596 RepID=UPI002306E26D|nr:hypothetical protein [Streptomyces sp. ACA25]MDB1086199.1 hypothetical protein [Streptomyces sp. ACA25]
MNSAEYLSQEDRPEFERVLDEALRAARRDPRLVPAGARFDAEELRANALDALPLIAGSAEDEYRRFVLLRERSRMPGGGGTEQQVPDGRAGAGLVAVVSVLLPVLAGVAAALFLAFGYGLRLAETEPAIAEPMRTAGWVFAVLMAVGMLVGGVELWVTALRNRATQIPVGGAARDSGSSPEELQRARHEWRRALLERGIAPFLREALASGGPGTDLPELPPGQRSREGRTPRLSFSSPNFSSPSEGRGDAGSGPRYSHPRFSSPKFGTSSDHDSDAGS